MRVPKAKIETFARELVEECTHDRQERISRYREWTGIYYTGSNTDTPSKHNRCYSHVDKLSSFLFSPSQVHYNVEFDGVEEPGWEQLASAASSYLNRQFSRSGSDLIFGQANEWGLVKGATIAKLTWGKSGFEPWCIQPEFFGVLNPSIEDLDRQEAFVQTFYLLPAQFRRLIADHPDKGEIMRSVQAHYDGSAASMLDQGYHEIVAGGGFPSAVIGVPGVTPINSPGFTGNVDWTTQQAGPQLAPDIAQKLIRVDDLWVWNDEREDWHTIRYVEPDLVIEGKYRARNLSDIPKSHPFVKVCSIDVPGYFWGRSEISNIWMNQKLLSARVNNIDQIFNLQARPSRSVIGAPSITDEKMRALLSPGGVLTEASPTAKIETYKPDMPQGALEYLQYLDGCFDEAAGFTPILSGQGEPGVRAGNHANTLLRTSSPRLRDRALAVERQAATWGELHLNMLRAKEVKIQTTEDGKDFLFNQLPPDANVVVDSHTSSPAFSGDNEQLAFALYKAQAIDPQSLIEAVHPPRQEVYVSRLRKKEKAHEAQLEQLHKQDPELWAKAVFGTGRSSRR